MPALSPITKIASAIIRFRWLIIVTVLGLSVFLGVQIRTLRLDTTLSSFLPRNDPISEHFKEVDRVFSGADLTLIGLETDNVFTPENLRFIHELTETLEAIPGVGQIISLTNIIDISKIEGGIEVKNLINPENIPSSPESLNQLRKYVLTHDMYRGSVISPAGKATLILAKIMVESDEVKVFREMRTQTLKLLARSSSSGIRQVYFAGFPPQMYYIDNIVRHDFQFLIPVTIILVIFVLFLNFRSFRGVVLPLLTVIFATTWVMGTMACLNRPLSMFSNIIPILLIAVGSAYGIHFVNRYYEEVRTHPARTSGIQKTIERVGLPIILAGLTTMIGFFSFITSNMPPIQESGLFIALGVGFALLISLCFIPACLSILPVRNVRTRTPSLIRIFDPDFVSRILKSSGSFLTRRRRLVLIIAGLIAAVSIFSLPRLTREVNFIEYFPPDSEYRVAEDMMFKYFGGTQPILIDIQGDILDPFVLKEIQRITLYLDTIPHADDPQSISDLICETNYQLNGRYAIPDTSAGVANLWLFLEGNEYIDMLIKEGNDRSLIQAKIDTYSTTEQIKMVNRLQDFLRNQAHQKVVDIERRDLSPPDQSVFDQIQLDLVLENLLHLIQGRLRVINFPAYTQKSREIIQQARALISAPGETPIGSEEKSSIENDVRNYLSSPEAEIAVDDPRLAKKIASDIAASSLWPDLGLPELKAILETNLSPLPPEDQEMLEWLAASLQDLVREGINRLLVRDQASRIISLLPSRLREDKNLPKHIEGILWARYDQHLGLDETLASRLSSFPVRETRETLFLETGGPVMFNRLYPMLVNNMIQSIFIALSLVLIILTIRFRSLAGGLISITPMILTVLINFGIMSILGIPIDDSTMMIASIAIGIGIDYSIHFISRFQEEINSRRTESEALSVTLQTTGKAILTNAFAVTMGFLALVFSSVVPAQRFGWLTAIMMMVSSISALTILPALLLSTRMKFLRRRN